MRPITEKVTEEQVYKLASLHCTSREIAEFFDVSVESLRTHFGPIIKKAKAEARQKLRQAQMEVALKGNVTMMIFLGKQMLGQSDNGPTENDDTIIDVSTAKQKLIDILEAKKNKQKVNAA